MRSVLVTGGAGFIGSHLVDTLLQAGRRVRVLDDLSSGSLNNLAGCIDDVEVIVGDVRDAGMVERALAGMDAACHLAAIVSVSRSFAELELVDDVNVGGTLSLLSGARRAGVGRVVCASSAAVYGDVRELPVREDAPPRPLSPYGAGKLAVEAYARTLAADDGPEVVCLRYFNVYGPRQDPSSDYAGVIARFLACGAEKRPFTVFGDGAQTRDFIYVADIARADMLALDVDMREQPGRFVVLNVGSGRETSVLDLTAAVSRAVRPRPWDGRPVAGFPADAAPLPAVVPADTVLVAGVAAGAASIHLEPSDPLPIRFEPARPGDIHRSCADIGAARSMLGFEPSVSLDEGLAATWDWWTGGDRSGTPGEV